MDMNFHPIDLDNHYYEPADCFSRHIEPGFRDMAIRAVATRSGNRRWAMGDRVARFLPHILLDGVPAPGALAELFRGEKVPEYSWDHILPEDNPAFMQRPARLSLLDEQGLDAALLLPSDGLVVEHDFADMPQALCANLRGFNHWLEEEWGYDPTQRILAAPILSLLDLNWAISELTRVVELGSSLALLKIGPFSGRSPADPAFDPFWARVEEMDVKIILHIGNEGFADLYGVHWGENPNNGLQRYSALQHYMCFGERPIVDTMAALILHNLFGRFPGLQVLSIENGGSWVGKLLVALDKAARMGAKGDWLGGPLTDRPSELFRRHVYVTPYYEDEILSLVELIGADRVLFGSDYPHPEGLADPIQFAESLHGLRPEEVRMIMRDNAANLLGLASRP